MTFTKILFFITVMSTISTAGYAENDPQTMKAIQQRLKPVAQVEVAPSASAAGKLTTATAGAGLSGKEVYEKHCIVCHDSGAAGSPKFGDKEAWKPRIAQGKEALYQHAIQGYKLMPLKGTCMTCSDDEIKKAVDYLISNGGGK
jgi:cytochrome c5